MTGILIHEACLPIGVDPDETINVSLLDAMRGDLCDSVTIADRPTRLGFTQASGYIRA